MLGFDGKPANHKRGRDLLGIVASVSGLDFPEMSISKAHMAYLSKIAFLWADEDTKFCI
jgi:hypothetical protein